MQIRLSDRHDRKRMTHDSMPLFVPTAQLDITSQSGIVWGPRRLSQISTDLQGLAGVYRIENEKNGRVYIGSTGNLYERWRQHRQMLRNNNHHANHFQNAYNKYGAGRFTFGVCAFVDDPSRLNETEQTFIIRYKSDKPRYGYNVQSLPMGAGSKPSPETRRKLSEAGKRRTHSPETLCKLSEAGKRRTHGPETRRKLSEARKRKNLSPETLRKLSEAGKALWQDPEYREKVLEARKKTSESKESQLCQPTQQSTAS